MVLAHQPGSAGTPRIRAASFRKRAALRGAAAAGSVRRAVRRRTDAAGKRAGHHRRHARVDQEQRVHAERDEERRDGRAGSRH